MTQEIGVSSTFLTGNFTRGLNRYLTGLAQAIAATNATTAAINNLGAQSAAVFASMGANARTTANALKAMATAARAANRALNPQTRSRGAGATQGGGPLNQQLNAATARANQQTTQQINAAANATRNLGTQAKTTTVSIKGMNAATIAAGTAIGTVAGGAILGLGRQIASMGSKILEIVTFFERLELSISFYVARSITAEDATVGFEEALARGTREAQGLSIWLQRLAVASPFTTRTVGILFRTAQAYGLTRKEAEQLTPLLLDFGAAAGLNEDILERLALAIGQIRSRGKLTGEEVRQLGNSGLPVRDILVKALGIANSEFDKLLESGALTTDVVIPHLIEALKAFEGAGERVAFGTIGGIVSAIEELQEISTAKFFTGFLEPLKDSFQGLFKVLNQPEVLAFITILGQELGENFKNAVFGVVDAIKGYVKAWNAVDPVVKQQIIVFAAATAGTLALIAAFGLLVLAVGIITNPVVLLATTVGFLISEWTSGFAVLKNITGRVATAVSGFIAGMVRSVGNAITGFVNFVTEVTQEFVGLEGTMVSFGFNIGASLAQGINASGTILASALQNLGSLLHFFLAPGSPPRIAPNIDDWGQATMEEYISAFGNANVKKALGPGLSIVSDTISQELINERQKAVDKLNAAHPDLNLTLAQDLQQIVQEGYKQVEEELADTAPVEAEATAAGIRVSESFINSFLSNLPKMTPKISEELQKVLSKIGRGAQLTRQGALAFGNFLGGFDDADFGILDTVSGVVQSFFQSLVDSGEIEDIDLPRLLFGAREGLAQGIQDIQRVGQVTESTMQRIRTTAGGASKFVLDLLAAYAPLARATEDVEAAQDNLNAITEKYKNIITPLRKELEALNEATRQNDEEEKILSLQRLIANEAVSGRRRSKAQLEINQILAERRVRGLENERDAATEAADEELEAREKVQDQMQKQLQNLQSSISAQLDQLGLFGQEASIVKKLREEAEKLREKELTEADLQLKLLEFQNEEVRDLIEAARAKYDLDRADSTELEKQQAQITLAEVALRRRNREAEALKLGIPLEAFTQFRDLEVTLDDLGVKVKDTFAAENMEGLGESLVDANAITAEWEKTLEKVRDRWNEIKAQILETATAINNNLPSFLKIFPEVEGGEPPIIESIKKYTGVLIGLGAAMAIWNIASRVTAVVVAIRSLMTVGAIGGAAGVGGAAAAGGGSAVIAGITTALVSLGLAALATTIYIKGLQLAMAAFGAAEEERFKENTQAETDALGGFGPRLKARIDEMIANLGLNNEEAKRALRDNITTAAIGAIQEGFGDEHVAASIGNAINRSIAEGLIADTPENRRVAAEFQANLLAILQLDETTEALALFKNVPIDATPSAVQQDKAHADFGTFLSGITDHKQKSQFATSIESLVKDATSLGMTRAKIDQLVFGAFGEGVKAGLVADTPDNRKAITGYVNGIIKQLKTDAEIKSPSELTRREIGMPLGEGILGGLNDALVAGNAELMANIMAIRDMVIENFTLMRTGSEAQARLMRTNVVQIFAGEKTGLLAQITAAFIGKEGAVPREIGKNFIVGIARGITDNKQKLADAIVGAMVFALGQGQLAVAKSISPTVDARLGPRQSPHSSSITNNNSRTNIYQLNVTSGQSSQGIISDYGIMRVMESR